jgi:hypothetical protein
MLNKENNFSLANNKSKTPRLALGIKEDVSKLARGLVDEIFISPSEIQTRNSRKAI